MRERGPPLRQLLAALALSALVCGAVLAVRYAGGLQVLEHTAYDQALRNARPSGSDERLMIVQITERDVRRLGRWPVTDATLGRVIRTLDGYGARAIGIDLYRDIPVPPGTSELDDVLRGTAQLVFVHQLGDDPVESIPPPSALRGTNRVGFNDVLADSDRTIRRALLFAEQGDEVHYAFALRLALLYLAESGVRPQSDADGRGHLSLGGTAFRPLASNHGGYVGADAAGYQMLIDYRGAARTFDSITLTELLSGSVDPARFRDRIVLVGTTATSTNDFFQLPFLARQQRGLANAGVAVHAHVASQIVRTALGESRPMRVLPEGLEIGTVALAALLAGGVGLFLRSVLAFAAVTVVGLLGLWAASGWLFGLGWWIPVVPPALAWTGGVAFVTAYLSSQERTQRDRLMRLFSQHVSPDVAEEIWRQRDAFLDGGRPRSQRLPVTVLFADMRGYTKQAEKMDPEDLMQWVNAFMEAMAQAVADHGGMVDDYFGDGLKANFGVPFPRESTEEVRSDALRAVECALAMARALQGLNARWSEIGRPTVAMRVGISSGTVVMGSLGGGDHLKYTSVGDVVVSAQRLESFDAVEHDFGQEPCRILISEATRALAADGLVVHPLGEHVLKGMSEAVAIHGVRGLSSRRED